MKGILLVTVLAIVVEALIEYAKSVGKMFTDGEIKTGVTQLISIVVSVLLCFAANVDLFQVLDVSFTYPWIGVALTGIFGSRGANYVSDLVKKFHDVKGENRDA